MLLNKILERKHSDTTTVAPIAERATDRLKDRRHLSVQMLDRAMIPVSGGTVCELITLLRMTHNLKLLNGLFLEFSISYMYLNMIY